MNINIKLFLHWIEQLYAYIIRDHNGSRGERWVVHCCPSLFQHVVNAIGVGQMTHHTSYGGSVQYVDYKYFTFVLHEDLINFCLINYGKANINFDFNPILHFKNYVLEIENEKHMRITQKEEKIKELSSKTESLKNKRWSFKVYLINFLMPGKILPKVRRNMINFGMKFLKENSI